MTTCPLTPRQLECVKLSADGYTMKNIAYALDLSFHTVNAYLRRAKDLVGVGTETALVAAALRKGWIT
jgi:DNA-binding CsgD family transcriptional regulator